jgi:chorismate mutase
MNDLTTLAAARAAIDEVDAQLAALLERRPGWPESSSG